MTEAKREKQPITLEMAIERLERIAKMARQPMHLGVLYDPGYTTIGPRPSKRVYDLYPGIDWDKGTVFVDTGERLCAPSEDQAKLSVWATKAQTTVGWIGVALRSSLTPEGKIKAIQGHLDELVGRPTAPHKVKS